jgi:sec-independent protein translocase protein TatA
MARYVAARSEDMTMGAISFPHILLLLAVVILLFGRGKISDLMGDVAKGIKSFKKGMADDDVVEKTEPAKRIESAPPTPASHSDIGSKVV